MSENNTAQVVPSPITEAMHVAACKVLTTATGLDGLPQRMLDAMLAADTTPAQHAPVRVKCDGNHGGPRCADPDCWNDSQDIAAACSVPDRLYFSSRNAIAKAAGVEVTAECNAIIQATLDHLRSTATAPAPAVPQGEPVDFDSIITDIETINCRYHGDPSYDLDPRDIRDEAAEVVRRHAAYYAAAPAAPSQPAVPQGWKLVPVEPTPDMEGAGRVNMAYGSCTARQVWIAMLAATPAAPSLPVTLTCDDIIRMARKAGMAPACWEGELSYQLLERFAIIAATAAPAQEPAVPQGDTVEIIGRKGGKENHLGTMRMPPRMKAREIAREQFGHFVDDDGSDAELCFGALEQLIDYMQAASAATSQEPAVPPLLSSDRVARFFGRLPENVNKYEAMLVREIEQTVRAQFINAPAVPSRLLQKLDASIAWLERGEVLPGTSACIGLDDIKTIRATLAAASSRPVTLTDDDIARCINVATCGRPFIGLMNSGGVPTAFSRSLADLLIAALRAKEQS